MSLGVCWRRLWRDEVVITTLYLNLAAFHSHSGEGAEVALLSLFEEGAAQATWASCVARRTAACERVVACQVALRKAAISAEMREIGLYVYTIQIYMGWVTVSTRVRREVVEKARRYGIDVSRFLREALEREVEKREAEELAALASRVAEDLRKASELFGEDFAVRSIREIRSR